MRGDRSPKWGSRSVDQRPVNGWRVGRHPTGSCHSQGFRVGTPEVAESSTLRVAIFRPCTSAVAAKREFAGEPSPAFGDLEVDRKDAAGEPVRNLAADPTLQARSARRFLHPGQALLQFSQSEHADPEPVFMTSQPLGDFGVRSSAAELREHVGVDEPAHRPGSLGKLLSRSIWSSTPRSGSKSSSRDFRRDRDFFR